MNLVQKALDLWLQITEIDPNATTYSMRDWDIHKINDELKESLKLDDTYVTTLMMMDYFVAEYLNERSFTINEMLDNFQNVTEYLAKCKELYSLLESEEILEVRNDFQEKVFSALKMAGIDREDVNDMVNDQHSMAFLRRDALRSMETLKLHQFYQGKAGDEKLKYVKKVHGFWNINSLIKAMSAPGMSGVSLNLIKDPLETSSYFAFAIRNGGTLTILTDKPEYSHPLQKYMSRRPGRDMSDRIFKHHFPYGLLNIEFDRRGDARVKSEKNSLVKYQTELYPLKSIQSLEPDEIIWTVMMFSLIENKFYRENFKTKKLSYTGEMLKVNNVLESVTNALTVTDYKTLEAPPLTKEDVKTDKLLDEWEHKPTQHNRWIEERYEDKVNESLLNLVGDNERVKLLTASSECKDMSLAEYEEIKDDFFRKDEVKQLTELQSLDPTSFGSSEEIIANQKWVARYNKAKMLQVEAEKEFKETSEQVKQWYIDHVTNNAEVLIDAIAKGTLETTDLIFKASSFGTEVETRNILSVCNSKNVDYSWNYGFHLNKGYHDRTNNYYCYVSGSESSVAGIFKPQTPEALAVLCGCEVKDLPEVLQHWTKERIYSGNHILSKIDPLEWVVKNPWEEMKFGVVIYLSKRVYNERRKKLNLPPNKFWETA